MKKHIIRDLRGMFGEPFAVEDMANRHGVHALIAHFDGTFSVYEESHDGDEPWLSEFVDYKAARDSFDREIGRLAEQPNWEAQREYDEAHGTDNGYDPAIVAWNEEFRNEY